MKRSALKNKLAFHFEFLCLGRVWECRRGPAPEDNFTAFKINRTVATLAKLLDECSFELVNRCRPTCHDIHSIVYAYVTNAKSLTVFHVRSSVLLLSFLCFLETHLFINLSK